jgi:colanic acid biosynthesis glycosyl transferase WcaI
MLSSTSFCSSYTSGRGATDRREGDPDSFSVKALALTTEFKRYTPIVRVGQEFRYARLSARAVLAARPDAVILSNIPLLAMLPLTWALRLRRVPYVLWWQDVYSDAIKAVSRQKLGLPGAFVGWVAQRFERQVAARASRIVAIADAFLDQLDEWRIPTDRATVIPNWGAIDEMPVRPRDNE